MNYHNTAPLAMVIDLICYGCYKIERHALCYHVAINGRHVFNILNVPKFGVFQENIKLRFRETAFKNVIHDVAKTLL